VAKGSRAHTEARSARRRKRERTRAFFATTGDGAAPAMKRSIALISRGLRLIASPRGTAPVLRGKCSSGRDQQKKIPLMNKTVLMKRRGQEKEGSRIKLSRKLSRKPSRKLAPAEPAGNSSSAASLPDDAFIHGTSL